MKNCKGSPIRLIVLLVILLIFSSSCNNSSSPTESPESDPGIVEQADEFDLTGIWKGTFIQELQSGGCPPMPTQQGDIQIEQTSDTFTMQFGPGFDCSPAEACYFVGTVEGDQYTATNSGVADDEGGVYTSSMTLVPMSPNSAQAMGNSTYTHPEMQCEWTTSLILSREANDDTE